MRGDRSIGGWVSRAAALFRAEPGEPRDLAALRALLAGFAFFIPVWIGAAQLFGYAAAALGLAVRVRRRAALSWRDAEVAAMALFAVFSVIAAMAGPRPELAARKLNRIVLLLAVFAPAASVAGRPGRAADGAARLLIAFVAGAVLRGGADVARILAGAAGCGWEPEAVFHLGNMRDPQFHMSALLILIAAGCGIRGTGGARGRLAAAVISGAAMLLHFKRGVWFAFAAAAGTLCLAYRRRTFVALAGLALLAAALPSVRARLGAIGRDLGEGSSRVRLWTKAAPVLIVRHPWGMGRGVLRNKDLQDLVRIPETKINHLHNNLLQVTVDCGWGGAAAWVAWMGAAGVAMVRRIRRAAGDPRAWVPIGTGAAFLGLHLNGLIEFNFGDSEIFMWFLLLLGVSRLWGLADGSGEGGAARAPAPA